MNLFGLSITRQKAVPVLSSVGAPGLVVCGSRSWFGSVFESFSGAWQRNIVVDDQRCLLAFSAIYACIARIANDISILRPMLMDTDNDIWREVREFSPYAGVLRKPNRYQTYIQFLLMWMIAKLMYGNAYILKERDSRGIVVALYPLPSQGVQVMVAPDGDVFYQISADSLSGVTDQILVPSSEIIHDRMNTLWHPLVGVSPIYAAGASATQGNRIQNNSEKFFANMSRPSGQLTAPGHIDDETAARLKRDFEDKFSGSNIGRLWVSGDGLKYEAMTMPAEQAQLVEQLKWTVEDVARPFHMPLFKIGAGQQPTHNNVGALQQQYLSETLQVHIEDIEQLLREGLSLPPRYGVQLDTEAFLRMDPKTRAETDAIDIGAGILKPNEGRWKRDLLPVEGGDTPYMQQQNYSLAALAKRDSKEDPFETTPKPAAPAPKPTTSAANDDDETDGAEIEAAALIEAVRKGLAYAA